MSSICEVKNPRRSLGVFNGFLTFNWGAGIVGIVEIVGIVGEIITKICNFQKIIIIKLAQIIIIKL